MALTLEQKIAQKEAEIARLKTAQRKLEAGQKIVVGGAVLKTAKKNPKVAKWLAETLRTEVTREIDVRRIEPILIELNKIKTD
jgi:hypothetical protein